MKKFYAMLLCVIVAASSMSVSAKKFRVITDVGLGYTMVNHKGKFLGWGVEDGFCIQPLISAGYQSNKLFIGGGLGLNHTFTEDGATSIPLFAHIRYDFFKNDPKTFSPFISYRVGYSYAAGDFSDSGLFINPSFGFRKGISSTVGLNLSIAYSLCGKGYYDYYDDYNCYEYTKTNISVILFNIGIDF